MLRKTTLMYLDIAVGLFVGFLVSFFSGEHSLLLILFGVLAALAPDLDFIFYLIRNKGRVDQYAHEHRDLLHKPLLFSLGGGILVGLIHPLYGVAWFFASIWHFIHDTYDGGWGIKWLHPFYFGYFTIARYSKKHHFKNKKEQHAYAKLHGNPNWLKDDYFSLHPSLILQWTTLAGVAILILIWVLR